MKHQLLLIAVVVAVLYFASRSSPGAGDRTALGPVTGPAAPYWDYNA